VGTFNKQKAFGQHFLIDGPVIQSIVKAATDALARHPEHALLEIGPGDGALTRPLMAAIPFEQKFFVAERDRELIAFWKPETRINQLLEGDFLNLPDEMIANLGPLVVVSNLPYSAGTAIVIRLCEMAKQIPEMVLMFQAEVAKRLYSGPSTPDRGSLTLFIQNEWEVEKLMVVKPTAFKPPPKVMSEVVRLTRRAQPMINVGTPEKLAAWNDLLKTAFKQRRKMLKGNFNSTAWQNAFMQSGVDPTKRAESLTWEEWIQIWKQKF
jgi:16S rRNA (adenine1518-N6/adenine1519-N6)-dimethyltransferase